jgi:hypothetical protein
MMKPSSEQQHAATLRELVDAIACSPIVVERPVVALPEGFEPIDVAILNWIVAEARRLRGVGLV